MQPTTVFRSCRTREITPNVRLLCDPDHPARLEGHSLHAVAAQQRHFLLAPALSSPGVVEPNRYQCIWSASAGQNSLWNMQSPRDTLCNLFECYFPSQFSGMQFIMAGTYGSAYRAIWNRSDGSAPLNVVIKRIDLERIDFARDGQELILVMREKMLLQRLHHEHISSIMLQYNDPLNSSIVYFVLEDGGPSTLDNLLRDAIQTQVPIMPSNVRVILTHILHGVAFLHHNMIIHRDIKGDNVCMSGFVARIIDFGMARSLIIEDPKADGGEMIKHHIDNMEDEKEVDDEEDGAFVTRQVSSVQRSAAQYSAPEALLSCGHYDSKVDVWALGCLLSELLYCCDKAQLQRNSALSSRFLERFLFRPAHTGDSALPSILAHAVAAADDLVDAPHSGGRAKMFSDRAWSSLLARGFIDPKHAAMNRSFAWTDLSSKFRTPELPADEVPIFEHLRALMMRMLAFDPDQRCSAAEALNLLTGAADHPVRVADAVLQEFRTLQEMLDGFRLHDDASRRDRCLRFIRHVNADLPSHPSPLALLLD